MSKDDALEAIYVDAKIVEYLDLIIAATHDPREAGVQRVVGILASGALEEDRERILGSAKERALHAKRTFVVPEDIRGAAMDTLSLTLNLADNPAASELGVEGAVQAILDWIEVP